MSHIVDYMRGVLAECDRAGIRATADPRSVNPPCVLITPPTLAVDTMHGAAADFSALVLVPGPGNLDAYAALDQLTQDVCRDVLVNWSRVTTVSYSPDDGPAYPANEVEWTATLDWPEPC